MKVLRSIISVKSKLEDQGITCILLGYAQNHKGGTYGMFNLRTKFIVLSRDIVWIKKYVVINYHENNTPRLALISSRMKKSLINGIMLKMILSRLKTSRLNKILRPSRILGGEKM